MRIFSRVVFGMVQWAARNGLATDPKAATAEEKGNSRRRTGIRGETFAYWYLRRNGYTIIAKNFQVSGTKGEIDLVGYDGQVLAFIEVKTRSGDPSAFGLPEDAVNSDKRHYVSRIARQFLAERKMRGVPFRFDVVAIEARRGSRPVVRLHKGAFT